MLRGKSASSTTLEVDMATADVHATTSTYESKAIRKNSLGPRQIFSIFSIILGLTIFAMSVSIIHEGFHIVSVLVNTLISCSMHTG